jgi:hypothetical protein
MKLDRVRHWLRYACLAVPAWGLVELGLHFYFARRAPTLEEWRAVRQEVERQKGPTDLVVIAPSWAEPNARYAFGEQLMPLRDVARPDVTRYATALEVGILGQTSPELDGWREQGRSKSGRFTFRKLSNPAAPASVWDFVDHLVPAHAQAFEVSAGERRTCSWNDNARVTTGNLGGPPTFPKQRFACPRGEPHFVGVTVIDGNPYVPRRCIWSHPFDGGSLVTRFQKVPLGKVIRGHGSLPWHLERDVTGGLVTLVVRANDRELGKLEHTDGEGWKLFEFSTGELAGQTADVEFEVSAAPATGRQFCFEADTR